MRHLWLQSMRKSSGKSTAYSSRANVFIILLFYGKKQAATQVPSCEICETFKNSGRYFWKQVTYYYVGHKLVIFNAALFTLLHLLLTRWWDMRLKHDVAWLWEEQTDSRKACQRKKKYCSCCITWMKNGYHFIKNIYNNYQNLLFRKLLAQLGNQTDKFGNFTRLQTYFGRPKPSGER